MVWILTAGRGEMGCGCWCTEPERSVSPHGTGKPNLTFSAVLGASSLQRAFQFLLQVSRENVGGAVCIWASGRAKNTAYPFTMDPDLFFPGGKFSVQQKRLSRHLQTFLLCTEINAAVPDWAEDDHFQRSPIHAHPKVPISMWANSCRCFLSIWSTTAVVQMVSTVFVLAPPVIAARLLTYFHIAMCCFRLWDINMFPAQISFLLSRQEWFRIQLEHET